VTQLNTSTHRLAIFASGSGTNAEEIFKFFRDHRKISVAGLLSNHPEAYALVRAANHGVPTMVFNRKQFRETDEVMRWLKEKQITHIVLAGFLWLIPENLIRTYPGKIINIHPALLPRFGGKGMYGMKVHEAVKAAGEAETGITIHEVNEQYDEGRILFKAICPVMPEDTPETIANKVHQLEYAWYPKVIENWVLESK
jgi:phosphoribosylglycinamide formyltransferase-1